MVHFARLLIVAALVNAFVLLARQDKNNTIKLISIGFVVFGVLGSIVLFIFDQKRPVKDSSVTT